MQYLAANWVTNSTWLSHKLAKHVCIFDFTISRYWDCLQVQYLAANWVTNSTWLSHKLAKHVCIFDFTISRYWEGGEDIKKVFREWTAKISFQHITLDTLLQTIAAKRILSLHAKISHYFTLRETEKTQFILNHTGILWSIVSIV